MSPWRESGEQKIAQMRIELRKVILEVTDCEKRDQLIQKLAPKSPLINDASPVCVETVREHLRAEQFKQLVTLYKQSHR